MHKKKLTSTDDFLGKAMANWLRPGQIFRWLRGLKEEKAY
jgi:hypothetical protein